MAGDLPVVTAAVEVYGDGSQSELIFVINHCQAIGKWITNRHREDLLLAASANEHVLSGRGGLAAGSVVKAETRSSYGGPGVMTPYLYSGGAQKCSVGGCSPEIWIIICIGMTPVHECTRVLFRLFC